MLLAVIVGLVLAPAPARVVSIYVGPQAREGFVETDKDVLDASKELRGRMRGELQKNPQFSVVEDEASASVRLYVLDRGEQVGPGSTTVGSVQKIGTGHAGSVTEIPSSTFVLRTLLRVGTYERPFVASSEWLRSSCAKRIAKDVTVWLVANHERIANKEQ